MIINGHRLPANIEHKRRELTVNEYNQEYLVGGHVDTRPPYQRDGVWSRRQKIAFIQSCFNENMAIPPFYLCMKKGRRQRVKFSNVDSQQRTLTIMGFFQDEFPVTIMEVRPLKDGGERHVSRRFLWSEVSTNEDLWELKEAFLRRKIELVIFDPMDDDDQRKIFMGLNNGTPLSPDEVNYCPNYLTRAILEHGFERVFRSTTISENFTDEDREYGPGLAAFMQSTNRDRKRFRHLRTMHEVLILCAGVCGSSKDHTGDKYDVTEPQPSGCRRVDRQKSATSMHAVLKTAELEYDGLRMDEEYESPDIEKALELLRLGDVMDRLVPIADLLTDLFFRNPTLGRTLNSKGEYENYLYPRNVIDPMCFLYAVLHTDDNNVTMGKLTKAKLADWLSRYYPAKRELDYDAATSDVQTMAAKYSIMRELFNRIFGTDVQPWKVEADLGRKPLEHIRRAVENAMKSK
jgi:hypothetical protein